MKAVGALVLILTAAILQVTFASLFPLRGAVLDCGLFAVVLIALAGGPRAAMLAVPMVALAVGFTTGRAPGLLLLAYVPALPLAAFIEEVRPPVTPYVRLAAVVLLSGVWARATLSLGPIVQGAEFDLPIMVRDLLVPGLVLDLLAFSVLYAPLRLTGRVQETLIPGRSRYLV